MNITGDYDQHGEVLPPQEIVPVTSVANLAASISTVMAEIEPIKKGGFNKHFGYKFTKIEDLLTEVTPKMAKHGLMIIQSEVGREVIDNMLYATFSFTLVHKSGEVWPDHPRLTGMARLKDSKGGIDDKAMNKCHTSARKYFLLALFQIPTDDEVDDADHDHGQAPPQQRDQQAPPMPPDRRRISERAAPVRPGTVPLVQFPLGTAPHRIEGVKGETPQTWAEKYCRAVLSSTGIEHVAKWRATNADLLDLLMEKAPDQHQKTKEIEENTVRKVSAERSVRVTPTGTRVVTGQPEKVKLNAEAFREELDALWTQIHSVDELDASWVERVDPVQNELFPPDLGDLSDLWGKHARRIETEMQQGG